jgi:23S rRNA (adenine2503-C2)-methyltransferase
MTQPVYFQSLTLSELAEHLLPLSRAEDPGKREKQALLRARQAFKWVYQRHVNHFSEMSDLSKEVREYLSATLTLYRLSVHHKQQAIDGTYKFLWNLGDSKTIESVIIPAALQEKDEVPEPDSEVFSGRVLRNSEEAPEVPLTREQFGRLTACISSQVGCAMACKFCLTGIQGLDRSLEVHEIVAQVHELRRRAPITNIVFMGMGEPLHNFENVTRACKILIDPNGLGFSKRKVTISTSGLVPKIEELGRTVDVSLAISLNATTDEIRSEIMPVNKKWPLKELLRACREYPLGSHRRITFEYVLLKDLNDQVEDAHRIVALLSGIPSKVNLIPFNEHFGSVYKRPSDSHVRKFQKVLLDRGMTATVRISRGRDILAACGQLKSLFGTARGTDKTLARAREASTLDRIPGV